MRKRARSEGEPAAASPVLRYSHLIVVHGIGDHAPNETALTFMNEFIRNLPRSRGYAVTPHNLIADVVSTPGGPGAAAAIQPDSIVFKPSYIIFEDRRRALTHLISFSEVRWKPITEAYLKANAGPPIPIPTWARSVGTRVLSHGYYERLWSEAVDNLATLLDRIRTAAAVYRKSAKLDKILNDFLGDVQMYTESEPLRDQIDDKFMNVLGEVSGFTQAALNQYAAENRLAAPPDVHPRIFVIAHSEGTVVSFHSLVRAAAANPRPDWLSRIHGLVTMGTPIDKHYTIWKTAFRKHILKGVQPDLAQIPWWNFWDFSDPVGYGLSCIFTRDDANLATDAELLCRIQKDEGYSRYPIPLKAHLDYWTDPDIHRIIIRDMMELAPDLSPAGLRSKWSRILPYADDIAYILGRALNIAALFLAVDLLLNAKPLQTAFASARPFLLRDLNEAWHTWIPHFWFWVLAPALVAPLELADFLFKDRFSGNARWVWSETVSGLRNAIVIALVGGAALKICHVLPPPIANAALALAAPVIAGKVLLEICNLSGVKILGVPLAGIIRWIATLLWTAVAVALSIALPIRPYNEMKDGFGYLMLLAGAVIAWQIHTNLHRGLLQVWRYAMDDDASAETRSDSSDA